MEWDGDRNGWRLRRHRQLTVLVTFGGRLDAVSGARLDALRAALGTERLNRLSGVDEQAEYPFADAADAEALLRAVRSQGVDADLRERASYAITRRRDGRDVLLIIEDAHEHEQTVAAMLAAGVEVE